MLAPDGKLVDGNGPRPALAPALLRELHRGMLRTRVLDEKMLLLQRQGRIGFYAEARGQEAAVIGGVAAMEPTDYIVPAHREIGAALYRGLLSCGERVKISAALTATRTTSGAGGRCPCTRRRRARCASSPPSSCVATQLPHATGLAWAAKLRHEPTVVLAYLGEGATSAEDFHARRELRGRLPGPL